MSIVVTPIPRLIDLAAPSFTLGTANAAGSAVTAVASDSTLLAFDAVDPAAVAAASVVGSATVSARRDHVHAGTTATGTVVDESITRFNGTGGASLQGYSSLSPTISDAGIISLTSGALAYPATAIASANANTLDDYQEGVWTPGIADSNNDGSGESQTYNIQRGYYTRVGDICHAFYYLGVTSIGTLTTGDQARIVGWPFPSINATQFSSASIMQGITLNLPGAYSVVGLMIDNAAFLLLTLWDATSGTTALSLAEFYTSGAAELRGVLTYRV